MLERYLEHIAVEWPSSNETVAEARVRLATKFPRTALRRMTHLGLLVGSALDGVALGPEDAVVYATSFAEARALEDYLGSFPSASPLLFQTSIHPGGLQQVLIGRQQPVARLWPLAGRPRLVEQALQIALLEPAERVVLAGGEERGSWMVDYQMASPISFAFGAVLTREDRNAKARVSFVEAEDPEQMPPTLEAWVRALANRSPLSWSGAGGTWALTWA